VVLQQGQEAPGLFVMLAGAAGVARDGKALATLASGDVFGEISLLTGQPATATVSTASKVFALELPAPDFRDLILRDPGAAAYLREISEDRLRAIGRLPVT
jgi:CRP-like cAMP-binding protein